jgi:hypothetical protein
MGRVARLILNYVGEKILIYEKLVKQATIGNTILSHHGKIKFHSHLNRHPHMNPNFYQTLFSISNPLKNLGTLT